MGRGFDGQVEPNFLVTLYIKQSFTSYLFAPPVPVGAFDLSIHLLAMTIHMAMRDRMPIRTSGSVLLWLLVHGQELPQLANRNSLDREHAILETVQILAMYRRYELAGHEAEKHPRREVVFAKSLAQLCVLCKCLREG